MRKHADLNTRHYHVMHVRLHIFSSGHGVERQWIVRTDLRQAGTRVKTGEGRIISSCQMRQIPQHVKTVLNRLESGAAFSAMSGNRVEARLVGACAAFRPTDRTRLNELRAVNYSVCDTPKASNVNAERIERASQKVEKRSRTSRARFEGVSVERVCKVMPDTVRNCAWQITRRLRQCKAEQGVASTQRGTLARVRRYRPVWRCPENQRWDRKPLTEMNGELRNTSPRQEEKLHIKDGECIALEHLIKCGGHLLVLFFFFTCSTFLKLFLTFENFFCSKLLKLFFNL